MGKPGWYNESVPHGMAAKGVKTRMDSKAKINPASFKAPNKKEVIKLNKYYLVDVKRGVYSPEAEYDNFKRAVKGNLVVQLSSGNDFVVPLKGSEIKKNNLKPGKIDVYQPVEMDTDGDGVADVDDCDPDDPNKQDDLLTNVELDSGGEGRVVTEHLKDAGKRELELVTPEGKVETIQKSDIKDHEKLETELGTDVEVGSYEFEQSVTRPEEVQTDGGFETVEVTRQPMTTDAHAPAKRSIKAKIDKFFEERDKKAHEHRQRTLKRLEEQSAVEKERVKLERFKYQESQLRQKTRGAKPSRGGRVSVGSFFNPPNVWSGKSVRGGAAVKKPLGRRTRTLTPTKTTRTAAAKRNLPSGYKVIGGKVYKLVG